MTSALKRRDVGILKMEDPQNQRFQYVKKVQFRMIWDIYVDAGRTKSQTVLPWQMGRLQNHKALGAPLGKQTRPSGVPIQHVDHDPNSHVI